jgi:acyl dehydratase
MATKSTSVNLSKFAAPITERYFEDYVPGAVFEFGSIRLDQDEIIEFARHFDPQSIHTDPIAAAQGPFAGLIASGWHTGGVIMRLFVDNYLSHVASMASPGLDELRWTRPVRPGDSLSIRVTVLEATPSRSKPDRGVVRSLVEALNQSGDVVMSFKAMNILQRRPGA